MDRAENLHRTSPVVDGHCDTLSVLEAQGRRLGQEARTGHLDLPRMRRGGIRVQFFALFVPPTQRARATVHVLELLDLFFRELEANPELVLVRSYRDVEAALAADRPAAVLAIEGGEALGGSLAVLRAYYRLGVRSLTLTWNHRNELADGVNEGRTGGGLTAFGVSVVREMNRLGMVVDLAHIAERGFWDVLEVSSAPVIVSHANCRRLCPHPRNLSDEQIRGLARNGGVLGLSFVPHFVTSRVPATLEDLLDHVDHVAGLVGVDHLGLGSDFDGTAVPVRDLEDAGRLVNFTRGLVARGYDEESIRKILGGNYLRVLARVLG
ncbi:MAG: dipeptidase [Desulfotomaculales bacterium]